MAGLADNPMRVVTAGAALAGAVLSVAAAHLDIVGTIAVVARLGHVLAAMVWGGLIVFMNMLHIRAIEGASDAERAGFVKWYVAGLGRGFSVSARLVVVSGLMLLVTSGYVLGNWVFGSAVFMSGPRSVVAWAGVLGGLVMAGLVEAGVRPAFRVILDPTAAPADKAAARAKAKRIARINLFLLLPVTAAMVGAAHA